MELLSPAGDRDALIAAISCGADAVYLGYTAFGARSYAGNFDASGLLEAVQYAHERGRKIYVTVNTLVKQAETDDLCDVLELLCNTGVDAAIVQDLGVVRLAQEQFPELTLHASTQMTIHNAQGARLMKKMGLTRVVPARECTLKEMRLMADEGVEIEAFVHGALCVAVSGQCLFSSMIGGRSGNRGKCAQPCRLPYQLDDGTSGYLLSPKDLMLIDHLPDLRDAGVYSLKLEGRMKRPEYVGIVTRAYREALDAAQANIPYKPTAQTLESLRQIFNRGGFTEGYALSKSNAALMSWEKPNHWGVCMGKVASVRGNLAKVSLQRDLHDGDGLQLRGSIESEMTYSGPETSKNNLATIRVASASVKPGDSIYRLTDAFQMREIREYMAADHKLIPLTAQLEAFPGCHARLTLADPEGREVSVTSDYLVEHAQQRALDQESAFKQLSRMGGTPYRLDSLKLTGDHAFMTAGMLNALRRSALDAMRSSRIQFIRRSAESRHSPVRMPAQEHLLIVQTERLSDADALLACGADVICWYPQDYTHTTLDAAIAECMNPVALVIPAFLRTEELSVLHSFVCRHANMIYAVVLNNPGQFDLDWPCRIWGGQGLNVANTKAAEFFYALGAERLTVSCELSYSEIRELAASGGNFELECYGRTQLMLLSHCPRRTKAGDLVQDAKCNACSSSNGCPAVYTDRKGYRFPARRLKMEHGCMLRLYNSVPTDMVKHATKIKKLDCSVKLAFTDEPLKLQKELVASYRSVLDGNGALHQAAEASTSGHLMRGIE